MAVRQAALAGGFSHLLGGGCGAYLLRHRAIAAALLTAGGIAFADWTGPLVRLSAVRISCSPAQNATTAPHIHFIMLSTGSPRRCRSLARSHGKA